MNDNVYIKTTGFTKTQVNDDVNATNWTAKYDGNVAKLSMNIHDNGSNEHVKMQMNNDDLMKLTKNNDLIKLFNIQTIQGPIDKRLQDTYLTKKRSKPIMYVVNVPTSNSCKKTSVKEEEPFVEEYQEPFVEESFTPEEQEEDDEDEPFEQFTPEQEEEYFTPEQEEAYFTPEQEEDDEPFEQFTPEQEEFIPEQEEYFTPKEQTPLMKPLSSKPKTSSPRSFLNEISSPKSSSNRSLNEILSPKSSSAQTLKKRSLPPLSSSKTFISPNNSEDDLVPVTNQHFRSPTTFSRLQRGGNQFAKGNRFAQGNQFAQGNRFIQGNNQYTQGSKYIKGGKKTKRMKRTKKRNIKKKRTTRISTFLRRLKIV